MLASINAGTPFWVSVTTALLVMSVLAADAGTPFASNSVGNFRQSGGQMKVKITRGYKGMPQGSNVGDEVDMDDDDFAEQRRLGNVERSNAQASQPTPGAGQPQDRPQANQQQDKSPTAVEPLTTDRFTGQDNSDR